MTSGLRPDDPDFPYLCVDRVKLMKEQTREFDGKKACWCPDDKEGFVAAEIQSSKGDELTVKLVESQQVSNSLFTKNTINVLNTLGNTF